MSKKLLKINFRQFLVINIVNYYLFTKNWQILSKIHFIQPIYCKVITIWFQLDPIYSINEILVDLMEKLHIHIIQLTKSAIIQSIRNFDLLYIYIETFIWPIKNYVHLIRIYIICSHLVILTRNLVCPFFKRHTSWINQIYN